MIIPSMRIPIMYLIYGIQKEPKEPGMQITFNPAVAA